MTETHNGLTDLHSLMATIAPVDRDKLQQVISSLQASEVYDANFSVVTNSVRHFARHTFLFALEKLSTPFITIMIILIQILTTIWTLVFTLKCVKKYLTKFSAYSGDIFTVWFSTFLSTGKSITDRGIQKRLHTKVHTMNIMRSEARPIKQSISRACCNHAFGIRESRQLVGFHQMHCCIDRSGIVHCARPFRAHLRLPLLSVQQCIW